MSRRPVNKVRSVLVANRGEIALRLVRSLKALGLRVVVAHSEVDAGGLAVRLARDAVEIGPAAAAESYLRADRILAAARAARVDAVHPGYGFLSENAAFAARVEAEGFTFLGPHPETIRLLGDKLQARRLMEEAGLPPIPGTRERLGDLRAARRAASRLGYPLLLKAAAGGGGKGIRLVREEAELEAAFHLAASEARSSFGSPLLFAERFLAGARHVEVQVLGDGHGGVRLFAERDCSLQRRLQKLLEETPCPVLAPPQREQLFQAAFALARRTRYRSLGTFEFLLAAEGTLHFLEANTRIQVEHPVTEMVSGVDLVAEQVRIAEGGRLAASSLEEALLPSRGAAVELRVNAEDPLSEFQPAAGTIEGLHLPAGPGVRVDTALREGLEVTPFYDPLLAKVVAWGEDRPQALARLEGALEEMVVSGVPTTIPVGLALLGDPAFRAGAYDCQFLTARLAGAAFLEARPGPEESRRLAAALAWLAHRERCAARRPAARGGPLSAWKRAARSTDP